MWETACASSDSLRALRRRSHNDSPSPPLALFRLLLHADLHQSRHVELLELLPLGVGQNRHAGRRPVQADRDNPLCIGGEVDNMALIRRHRAGEQLDEGVSVERVVLRGLVQDLVLRQGCAKG